MARYTGGNARGVQGPRSGTGAARPDAGEMTSTAVPALSLSMLEYYLFSFAWVSL